jgi:Ni/Co efflux regulator RcnB
MRKLTLAAVLIGLAVALGAVCLGQSSDGQSLGDVARKQRQKQQAKDTQTQPKKVITNEDLPANSDSSSGFGGASSSARAKPAEPNYQPPSDGPTEASAARWKTMIQAQKDTVASLQDRIEKLNSSIRFVQSNLYYNGVEYNEMQRRKQLEVEQLSKQLEQQKQKLQEMQGAARKAGFGSAVYDP